MKVMEELTMSKTAILVKNNGLTGQDSNIENVQFTKVCYADINAIYDLKSS